MKMSYHSSSSSSSAPSSCSSTTSLSPDTQTSSSSSTSVAERKQPVSDQTQIRPQMHPFGSSHGENTDNNHGGLVTNVAHVKRYMNSPFGLNRHYLTMPEDPKLHVNTGSSAGRKKNRAPADELEDSESDMMSSSSNTKPHPVSDKHKACDLSVIAGGSSSPVSSGSPSDRWLDYKRRKANHTKLAPKTYTKNPISPAGDAGLDASRCNAKVAADRKCALDCASTDDQAEPSKPSWPGAALVDTQLAKSGCESNSLLVRFSSIMYATFLVILGCILHVSELRQKSKNSSDHIYTTIVALIGISWLVFLQTDLQRYKRYASKYILIESIFNDRRQTRDESELAFRQLMDPSARSSASSSASLVNDRMSMNTEVIFKKTAYTMYQHRAALERNRAQMSHTTPNTERDALHYGNPRTSTLSISSGIDRSIWPAAKAAASPDKETLIPAYKFLHGKMGANFYLKCGMAAFCFGHVIHEGLRFGQQVYFFATANVPCRDLAALIAHLVTPLYSFYQLFMMFKYSNLVINRHKVLARFGLMHIIGTSVTFWFRTILEEAFEDFVHKMDYFKAQNKPLTDLVPTSSKQTLETSDTSLMSLMNAAINSSPSFKSSSDVSDNSLSKAQSLLTLMSSPISATITPQMVRHLPDSYACAQNTLLTTKSMNALPYLYPFTIEYNLLLAATFLSLYFNVGKIGKLAKAHEDCKPVYGPPLYAGMFPQSAQDSSSTQTGSNDHLPGAFRTQSHGGQRSDEKEQHNGEYKSNFVVNADCHSANKGLFCGFFVLLVTLVTIVIFFVTINKPTHIHLGIKINLIQEATLTALILIVTLAGFKQVVKLNRNPYLKEKVTTDDVLMLIPLPFFFIHSLLSFRAETATMSSGSVSTLSTVVLQRVHPHQSDPMATSTGSLQSILLSTNNNNSNNSSIEGDNRIGVGRNGSDDSSNSGGSSSGGSSSSGSSSDGGGTGSINRGGGNNRSNIRFTRIENKIRSNIMPHDQLNGTSGHLNDGFISNINNINGDRSGRNSSSIDGAADNSNSSHIDHFKLITVALNIVVMIEVLVQTNFIIDGMRRCSQSRYLRFKKPGRELITFAILLNITYWIVATFETKSVEQYKTEIEYYGPLPYMFISHTTLPVMLFYRYHSSVCLAEIWNRAYKPPKRR